MTAEKLGAPIGAGFGLGFVLANTGALPSGVAMVLRVIAVVAFVAVFVMLRRGRSLMGPFPRRRVVASVGVIGSSELWRS